MLPDELLVRIIANLRIFDGANFGSIVGSHGVADAPDAETVKAEIAESKDFMTRFRERSAANAGHLSEGLELSVFRGFFRDVGRLCGMVYRVQRDAARMTDSVETPTRAIPRRAPRGGLHLEIWPRK